MPALPATATLGLICSHVARRRARPRKLQTMTTAAFNSPPLAGAPERSLRENPGRLRPPGADDVGHGAAALLDRVASLLRDPEAGPETKERVAAARARALAIAPSGGSELAVVTLLADLLVVSAVDRAWSRAEAAELVEKIAAVSALSPSFLRTSACLRALRDPTVLELPAALAIETVLRILVALAPMREVSLWRRDVDGGIDCVASAGAQPPSGRARETAADALAAPQGDAPASGSTRALPVLCWGGPEAVLVVGPERGRPAAASALAEEAARVLGVVLERHVALQRNAERERSLVEASERRLTRLAFDLHDGPVQDVVALAAEVRFLRDALVGSSEPLDGAAAARARFDTLEAHLLEVGRELRELSSSLEPTRALRSVPDALAKQVEALNSQEGIEATLELAGDFALLTASQRIAVLRIVQEALANVREHSGARRVRVAASVAGGFVRLEVVDDGRGFEVAATLSSAAGSGRLGLVGMSERVRLLDGRMDVQSRPGGPTSISAVLRLWQPAPAPASAD